MRLSWFFVSTLLWSVHAYAQSGYELRIEADRPVSFFTKRFSYQSHPKDSLKADKEWKQLFNSLREHGYLAASADSVWSDSTHTYVRLYVGERSEQLLLANGNVPENLLTGAGIKNVVQSRKPVSVEAIAAIKEKLLRTCENSGYPFATVWLDSFSRLGSYTQAKVYLDKHDLILIDTIRIFGKTKVKRVFLKNYLGLKTGKPYNESNVAKITQRLSELQFVEPLQPHTVEFQNGKAAVNLYLKDKKASQFNFLLGLLPGSSGKKLLVTGDARMHLFSPFGLGEEFLVQWQKLQPKTQTLDVRFSYPYLLGLPLGISAQFQLYKRDTTYLDLHGDYGIQYQIIGSSYLKASLKQQNTIILNVDTAYIKSTRTLPKNLDISTNEFALEYFLQKLDYRFNPTSGYVLTVQASAGVKKIKKNNAIAGLYDELTATNFSFLYDTTKLKTFQFQVNLSVEKFWRLAARHTIKTSFDGGYFYSPSILENEKYRLGGVNSLRGFDDQSIFTPYYAMANLEYRFLLSKNSYFSAFFNSAMVQDVRPGKGPFDFPIGFGAGAAIETKAGIFGITYAMGRQLDNKVSFKSAKIHFGYVNYF